MGRVCRCVCMFVSLYLCVCVSCTNTQGGHCHGNNQSLSLSGIAGHQQSACMFPCVSEYVCVSLCKMGRNDGEICMREGERGREALNRKRGCEIEDREETKK